MTTDSAETILDLLASVAETGDLRGHLNLPLYDKAVLDSMKTVELIIELEKAFGIEISLSEFERDDWATPAKLIRDIERRMKT
jgi:D-alanine--poly(phosphoribitol) ligase subunit 2